MFLEKVMCWWFEREKDQAQLVQKSGHSAGPWDNEKNSSLINIIFIFYKVGE